MRTKIIGVYSIFLGVAVLGIWAIILLKNKIPEGFTEVFFHLLSELIMAIICIISGHRLLKKGNKATSLNLFGLGMVIYSVLNAAGNYGQKGENTIMIIFLAIFVITTVCIIIQLLVRIN